jgi:hypothetical protein
MSELSFKARNLLESGAVTPDTFRESGGLIDLGRHSEAPTEQEIEQASETVRVSQGLTRAQRERLPEKLAAQLMDHYMDPDVLNNQNDFNPIRDGIPQCVHHPFDPANGKVGCIHSCGAKDPNVVLPVERDYTVLDVFHWVTGVVSLGITAAERAKGWHRPTDLTR